MALLSGCISKLKASIEELKADFHSLSPIRLKQCKAEGCGVAVFWDYKSELQYCSPQCRNEDLLKSAGLKLKSDIEDLEKQDSYLPGRHVFIIGVGYFSTMCSVAVCPHFDHLIAASATLQELKLFMACLG